MIRTILFKCPLRYEIIMNNSERFRKGVPYCKPR